MPYVQSVAYIQRELELLHTPSAQLARMSIDYYKGCTPISVNLAYEIIETVNAEMKAITRTQFRRF